MLVQLRLLVDHGLHLLALIVNFLLERAEFLLHNAVFTCGQGINLVRSDLTLQLLQMSLSIHSNEYSQLHA